ncbi:SDR family NAD(P)-dependent oxidoreductase [Dyadobacter frigoris]|uniref:SDR family NAD(P)-dependent oxidoreductase n=2 Tax=Dyadobacter frigoris TaxID=2576211 RepID=A0A4U6CYT6_9BACT|nr:SDR family NAD(P)-dependent oxidoreductase [Dyadobacter frigoris]
MELQIETSGVNTNTPQNQPVALVTGANQGIGFQVAKELVANGYTVLLGSRNLENGEIAAKKIGKNTYAIQLDVTDKESINAAAERVRNEFGRLDLLVNNAAISNAGAPGRTLEEMMQSSQASVASLDEVRAVFETNVFGVLAVTQAMLPILRKVPAARIVNVSSGVGSLTLNSDPTFPYRPGFGVIYAASKTALNAITLSFAIELESTNIKVNAVSPGFTATALNNFAGVETIEEGSRSVVRAALDKNGPTGTFSGPDGLFPW